MPKLTIRAQLIRGLERLGYQRDLRAKASKYAVFIDHVRPERRLYVGRIDALRGGRNVATSIPLDGLKAKVLAAGLPNEWPSS